MKRVYLAVGFLLLTTSALRADFKDSLASRLSVDPTYLVVNLPPRPEAWPGAIFTWNLRIPIHRGNSKDPALRSGTPIAINATEAIDVSAGAKGGYASWLGLSASAADLADVTLSLPDVTVVDMEVGELIKRVKASDEAVKAAKRGQAPLIVIKSYAATPIITVKRKSGVSAEAWAKLNKEAQVALQAQMTSADSITYKGSEPIVFAFETQQVDFDLKDLAKDVITIRLASLPSNLFAVREEVTDRALASITGISVEDIKKHGITGGDASIFRNPLKGMFK